MFPYLPYFAPLAFLAVAGGLYLTVPAPPPPSLAVRTEAAIAFQKLKLEDRAGRLFAEVLSEDPTNGRANFAIGVAATEVGRFKEAEHRLKTALAKDPENAETNFALGVAYQKAKRFKEAEEVYQALRKTAPDDARVINNLAEIAISRGRYAEARTMLREYLDRLPKHDRRRRHTEKRIRRLTAAIGDAPSPAPSAAASPAPKKK